MNTSKLSISTRMAIPNNFGFAKGENGTISALVKVNKNIDKELKDLGASIQGLMQGQTTGEIFSIRFPINSLDKISEIEGLVYLDIGEKIDPIGGGANQNGMYDNKSIVIKSQSFIEKNKTNLLIVGAVVLGYFAYKKFIK